MIIPVQVIKMDKFSMIIGLILAVLMVSFGAVLVYSSPSGGDSYTADNAIKTATQYVTGDETYKFDGMADSLNMSASGSPAADTHVIAIEFTSTHGGYGDRKDAMVIQVLTPHTAVITVEKGRVTSAVMDESWDMMTEKSVSTSPVTMPKLDGTAGDRDGSIPPA